jgi:hypothetical protein
MRAEVKKIVEAENQKRGEKMRAAGLLDEEPKPAPVIPPKSTAPALTASTSAAPTTNSTSPTQLAVTQTPSIDRSGIWWLLGVLAALLVGTMLALRCKSARSAKK